jgi:rhodanese-related sulfurtransferase
VEDDKGWCRGDSETSWSWRRYHGYRFTAPHAWDESDAKAGGSIRIPPDEVEKHIADVRRDKFGVVYCTWPNENSSTRVALALEEHGFEDIHPLIGGFDAWRQAGLPVERK